MWQFKKHTNQTTTMLILTFFENFTTSSLMIDSLVKGDASGEASGVAAGSVHTRDQNYDECTAEFEYCNDESAILENKINDVSEKNKICRI